MLPGFIRPKTARPLLGVINSLVLGFRDDKFLETMEGMHIRPMEVEKKRTWYTFGARSKERLRGRPGDLVLHTEPASIETTC
jgi:hypothetical protein